MKYSLRSLMTFSIRDMFLVTMIVALALGWWLDHQRAEDYARRVSEFRWRLRAVELKTYGGPNYDDIWDETDSPNHSASAPNPPKNQSGPHVDP